MKLFSYDFWFSPINLRNTFVHIVIGSAVFMFTWDMTAHNLSFSFLNLGVFAFTIEVAQWVQRDFIMRNKWLDTLRDFFTYSHAPVIFYFVR